MADTNAALLAALMTALDGNVGAPVYSYVPMDTKPNPAVHIIGDFSIENVGSKRDAVDKISFDVTTVYQGQSRLPFYTMVESVRAALENAALSETGFTFFRPIRTASTETVFDDGLTRIMRQNFETVVQPA